MISIGFLYWLILLLVIFFAVWSPPEASPYYGWHRRGSLVVFLVLFFLIGLKEWGWPIGG